MCLDTVESQKFDGSYRHSKCSLPAPRVALLSGPQAGSGKSPGRLRLFHVTEVSSRALYHNLPKTTTCTIKESLHHYIYTARTQRLISPNDYSAVEDLGCTTGCTPPFPQVEVPTSLLAFALKAPYTILQSSA